MWIIFLILMCGIAQADNVYYNKTTGQVMTITKDPVILSSNDKQVIISTTLPDNFDIKTLTEPLSYYNYSNGAFVLNTAMIVSENNSKVTIAQAAQDKNNAKASAIAKLTDAITKVNPSDVLTNQELNAVMGQ